jgi:hypothetical protein
MTEPQLTNTAFALIGFIAWTLALLVLMESIRTYLGSGPINFVAGWLAA